MVDMGLAGTVTVAAGLVDFGREEMGSEETDSVGKAMVAQGLAAMGWGVKAKAVVDWEAAPEVTGVACLGVVEAGWAVMELGATVKAEMG